MMGHADPSPSAWIAGHAPLVPRGAAVLDLACGNGRHTRLFLRRGHPVTAVDRDTSALQGREHPGLEVVTADLEQGPWPLGGRTFGDVVVSHYLWRPLWPRILESVAEPGVLIYETFALGNERYGRPRNPDFLLRPGELLDAVRGVLTVRAYEYGLYEEEAGDGSSRRAVKQRICAVRGA